MEHRNTTPSPQAGTDGKEMTHGLLISYAHSGSFAAHQLQKLRAGAYPPGSNWTASAYSKKWTIATPTKRPTDFGGGVAGLSSLAISSTAPKTAGKIEEAKLSRPESMLRHDGEAKPQEGPGIREESPSSPASSTSVSG